MKLKILKKKLFKQSGETSMRKCRCQSAGCVFFMEVLSHRFSLMQIEKKKKKERERDYAWLYENPEYAHVFSCLICFLFYHVWNMDVLSNGLIISAKGELVVVLHDGKNDVTSMSSSGC